MAQTPPQGLKNVALLALFKPCIGRQHFRLDEATGNLALPVGVEHPSHPVAGLPHWRWGLSWRSSDPPSSFRRRR
eukprot:scaffold1173_cov405-Prasinococcus_capsulatus_cf.AAC.13